jgi:Ca2+-binding EF-hand superfamily protein
MPYLGCFAVGGCLAFAFQQYRINKNSEEIESLQSRMRVNDELYKHTIQQWKSDYQKLYQVYQELERESIERDYEEFKAPDADGDDIITQAEFNTYVRKYLASFPELSEQDFPKFEEFDMNHDGKVTFDEWQQFLMLQKIKEDQKLKNIQSGENKASTDYSDMLSVLYDQSAQANSFSGLQKQISAGVASGKSSNQQQHQQQARGRRQ